MGVAPQVGVDARDPHVGAGVNVCVGVEHLGVAKSCVLFIYQSQRSCTQSLDMDSSVVGISSAGGGSANGLSYESKGLGKVEYTRRALSDGELLQQQQDECCNRRTAVIRERRKYWRSRIRLRPRKIVVLGDMGTGKSSLVSSYTKDQFHETYSPTILRTVSTDVNVKMNTVEQKLDIIIIDTPGRKDYKPIRLCAYKKVDLILLVFALDEPETLDQACNYWMSEINEAFNPSIPLILVGTKQDTRDEICANLCSCDLCSTSLRYSCWNIATTRSAGHITKGIVITYKQGERAADMIGANAYIETSAKYRIGIRDVFERGSNIAIRRNRRKRKIRGQGIEGSCVIL